MHGAGKSDAELRAACDARVGLIVVDGIEELERLARLARDTGARVNAILRLNVGIEARTHAFVRTGGDDTKFGIHPRDETAAIAILQEHPGLFFAGVHAHLGSQIFQRDAYVAHARALVEAAARFAAAGLNAQRIVVGGGFGVGTHPNAESLDIPATLGAMLEVLRAGAREHRFPVPLLGIEPGRAIVARAGTTLYRVLAVKRQSERIFVIVDGGIAENPRPALYGARHHVVAGRLHSTATEPMTLCGRSCENDELGTVALPTDIRSGDLLAMYATGAYTYSMAGNYNRFPRPAVVGVAGGSQRLLARRESLDDVLRNDVEPVESDRARAAF